MLCRRCGKPAEKACAKCQKAMYCSKECQVAAWPLHKIKCQKPPTNEEIAIAKNIYFKSVIDKLSGNVFILSAHNYCDTTPGVVFAQIGVPIDDFLHTHEHFIHLNYSTIENYLTYAEGKLGLTLDTHLQCDLLLSIEKSRKGTTPVIFVFTDGYHLTVCEPVEALNFDIIRERYAKPQHDWTIHIKL